MTKQTEQLTLNDKIKFDSKGGAILGVLEGPVADFIHPTRNGRHYSEELWENVLKNPLVQEQFKNGGIVGELDHPVDREDICTEKVAIIMPEPPVKKNGQYYGKFNILDTPCGRIVHTLAKAGFKLGVSSRGTGDVDDYTDEVDPSSYEFTCFDVVLLPAVKTARMNLVTEGLESKKPDFKKLLKESIDKSSKEDQKVMKETLKHIGIKLDEAKEFGELSTYLSSHLKEIYDDDRNVSKLSNNIITALNNACKNTSINDSEKRKANNYQSYLKVNANKLSYNQVRRIINDLISEDINLTEDFNKEDKHICVICGKDFEGYGNNAQPVKDGLCCDDCNTQIVIPARLKQIGLKENIEGKKEGEELPKEDIIEPETLDDLDIQKEDEASECCVDDAKLIELLHKFLEKQGLELDGKGDEENDFVELYHEIVCPNCVSDQEGEQPEDLDIDEKEVEIKEPEVEDNESDQLVEQLQKLLKENGNLKEELKKLQTEKAVSGAKVTRLNEELNSFKSVAASAGKKVLGMKSLETKTNDLLKENESLKESLDKGVKKAEFQENRISKLVESKETLSNKVTEVETENKKLKESLEAVKQSSNKKLTEARGIVTKVKTLAEQYKQLAHKNANKYIELKARGLGISKNEIINRLDESYTLEDVDKVCESLKDYSLNISSLPFAFDKPGDARVRLREDRSKDPLRTIDSEYDDDVDDDLLDLARLKKY